MNIKETSLQKALNAAACRELPKVLGDEDTAVSYWVKAIVLVKKKNLSQSYCLAERGSDGAIRYTADYGLPSPIYGLVSIHPYVVVDVKRFGYDGDDARFKSYIAHKCGVSVSDLSDNTDEDWARARIEYAIRAQEESDRRFQITGKIEAEEPKLEFEEIAGPAITAEDGSQEAITVVSSGADYKPYSRRGRKPKK